MAAKLTDRQAEVLGVYRMYQALHGRPPSFREVMDWFGFSGPNAVTRHLDALIRKGEMIRSGSGYYVPATREIECECPHCGGAVVIVESYEA